MPLRRVFLFLFLASLAQADKVILKNGKIYEGRIMGETQTSLLLSQPNKSPQFIPLNEIMTIVREKNPEAPNPDKDRFIHLEIALTGGFPSSDQMDLSPHAGLSALGGFRLHPLVQVEAGLNWEPAMTGEFAVTDGTTLRRYEHFYGWGGGFGLRLFPLALAWKSDWEPYVNGGYRWNQLVFKGSGDEASGNSWNVGLGLSKRLGRRLFWENRLSYQQAAFDTLQFLSREGTLRPTVKISSWILTTGLSFRL